MYLGAPLFLLASFIVGMLHPLKDEKLRQPLDGFCTVIKCSLRGLVDLLSFNLLP